MKRCGATYGCSACIVLPLCRVYAGEWCVLLGEMVKGMIGTSTTERRDRIVCQHACGARRCQAAKRGKLLSE